MLLVLFYVFSVEIFILLPNVPCNVQLVQLNGENNGVVLESDRNRRFHCLHELRYVFNKVCAAGSEASLHFF